MAGRAPAAAVDARPRSAAAQVAADLFELTKPKVQTLLLFTTVTTMLIAGSPSIGLILATCLGGYLSAGGAGAVNHWYDRDIDAAMARTANRPVPSGRIPGRIALWFGIALAAASVVELTLLVNPLARALSFCGFAGYGGVYTVWLKRRTPQNIVIGGAAGAVAPLVGWAAVTGEIGLPAVFMFALIFYWTPPHFWALSLLAKNDYARAGIPMLPVVRGERETARQILLYTLLLAGLSVLPFVAGSFGAVYLVSAVVLGAGFLWLAVKLVRDTSSVNARHVFLYSLVYLALLFAAIGLDRAIPIS